MGIMVMRTTMIDNKRPGRRMVRDAALRAAPHHEAGGKQSSDQETAPKEPLILRNPPRARAQAGVSKDAGALAPLPPDPSPQGGAEKSAADLSPGALYRLMAWLSPSYPVGAFSYSGGVEWAVEAGDITDRHTLERWLTVVIGQGGGFCDAVFFVHAHRAVAAKDDLSLRDVAELAAAFAPSKERHLETTAQGAAFVQATRAAWNCAALYTLASVWDGPVAYPVAVGVASAGHGIALQAALGAYLHAVTANLISAGVRLIPLGQTDGQRALAALEKLAAATAARALATKLDDVGGAALRADLASMRHETQYTRLFRS
jgi:urease accessory protein